MSLLEFHGVTKTFGGLVAVSDLSLRIEAGGIIAMIGPNGAGKSTAFNLISGVYRPAAGTVSFDGRPLTGLSIAAITKAGVARTFQNIRLFSYMTVLQNVMAGRDARMRAGVLSAVLHTPNQRREERAVRETARELLRFVGLEAVAGSEARNLPYGSQRRLEIARALASDPKLLLLDEPAAGMNPREKENLVALVGEIRSRGTTVFLVEHDMKLVMNLCERIIVLDHGEKICEGTPAEVRADERVIAAYLGAPAGSN